MIRKYRFIVELDIEISEEEDIDDMPENIAWGIGQRVVSGVVENDICWEFDDPEHMIKEVHSYYIYDSDFRKMRIDGQDFKPFSKTIREEKLEILTK